MPISGGGSEKGLPVNRMVEGIAALGLALFLAVSMAFFIGGLLAELGLMVVSAYLAGVDREPFAHVWWRCHKHFYSVWLGLSLTLLTLVGAVLFWVDAEYPL